MQKLLIGGLVVALAGLAGLGVMVFSARGDLRVAESAIEALKTEQAATRAAIDGEIARLRDADAAAVEERRKALDELRGQVNSARRLASGAEGRIDATHAETLRNLETLSARLNANETTIRTQETQQAQIATELTGVRQASSTAQAEVTAVSSEVSAVKADVSANRQRLDEALGELRKTSGDLGQLSGLIATNTQQIGLLKALGDRNYVEFTVFKRKEGTRMGAIAVVVKKTDVKNQRYSVDLIVNDVTIEKKDRNINEPLQFYLGKALYELVVNRVGQDQLIGYLSSPKVIVAQ